MQYHVGTFDESLFTVPHGYARSAGLHVLPRTRLPGAGGGAKLIIPPQEIAESVARSFERPGYQERKGEWRALIRMLDKTDTSYKT